MFTFAGESPYKRATYRYTPLLAMMLIPCHFKFFGFLAQIWGKLIFAASDIAGGVLIEKILKSRGVSADLRWYLNAGVWMLNPFVAGISTRGNAESIMAALVLSMLYAILKDQIILAGMIFGLSVHFKVYPILYAVPIWFGVDYLVKSNKYQKRNIKFRLHLFSKRRIIFGIVSFISFISLNWLMYLYYGQNFLQETYLYHITRKDHRHNFSLYFLHMYLSSNQFFEAPWSTINSVLSFAPQLVLVFFLGIFLSQDIFLACFLQTFAFVALNKVCTSQYFMWYICLLPLVLPSSDLVTKSKRKALFLLTIWIAGQGLWLYFAYRLEHLGDATFISLFLSSTIFYFVHMYIMVTFIDCAKLSTA